MLGAPRDVIYIDVRTRRKYDVIECDLTLVRVGSNLYAPCVCIERGRVAANDLNRGSSEESRTR